jgi:aspartate kinase
VARLVQKFGGSSLADADRIRSVAVRVVTAADSGHEVCVVVSAMGQTTDDLLALATHVSTRPDARELDMLLTAGERISMALLSMAIIELGREALSFTGPQAGILTDTRHGRARIMEVRPARIVEALGCGKVVIVAGFQGRSTGRDVTTLGRGGSDMTAVALAAALGADVCEIYTDMAGVFTADPRVVPEARKLSTVSYEEMLELSSYGSKVLMSRSVEVARAQGVRIHVRSSFTDEEGTWIEKEERMEQAIISGIAHDSSEAKVTILGVPDRPGIAAQVFRPLADAGVRVDMIVQNVSSEGKTDISFTLPEDDLPGIEQLLATVGEEVGSSGIVADPDIAKISLVGAGMKSDSAVVADMFDALADAGINIEIISTSSIRISCVIRSTSLERAVRVVHDRFRLSDPLLEAPERASG